MKTRLLWGLVGMLLLALLVNGFLLYRERRHAKQLENQTINAQQTYEKAQKKLDSVRTQRAGKPLGRREREGILRDFAKGIGH